MTPRYAVLAAPDSWYLRDLARAAAGRCELIPACFNELRGEISGGALQVAAGEVALDACDGVLVRTMPPGSLEQVVLRMDLLQRLEAAGVPVLNPPRALEAAVDKFLTSAKLAAAGLPTPRTIVCQSADDALAAFSKLGENVVVKPLFGAEGRGITRLTDDALALRAFKMLAQLGAALYVQEYIEHEGCDLRLLVLGERVLAMRRRNPLDWRTNVSRGASTERHQPTPRECELALTAARVIGAPLAGVDLLPAKDGQTYVIEVNAVPGWKALANTLEIDVAALVLDYLREHSAAPRRG